MSSSLQPVTTNDEPSVDFQVKLTENFDLISRSIVVSGGLLFHLRSEDYLRDKNVYLTNKRATDNDKINILLTALSQVPEHLTVSVFTKFISALRQDKQDHVANIFCPESDLLPLSSEHYRQLLGCAGQVCKFLDPLNGLLDRLSDAGVFSDSDRQRVETAESKGLDAMTRQTIDILSRKADTAFELFITALRDSGQEHVATILRPDSTEIPMSDEHRRLLILKTSKIIDILDPEFRLTVSLVSNGVFSKHDEQIINACTSYAEKSRKLIDIMLRKSNSAFEHFINLLKETQQGHVAYVLTGAGEPPMSELRLKILKTERKKLIEIIDNKTSLLVDKLFADDVLNRVDKECIAAETTEYGKNRVLLDAVARKSQSAYNRFLQALKNVSQEHIAAELEGLEPRGIVRPYSLFPRLKSCLSNERRCMLGVALCDNKLFAICLRSDTILVLGPNNEQLPSIIGKGLKQPRDIVACAETRQLYIADDTGCVWRVALDGDKWQPIEAMSWTPYSLSVTSSRLLVTSYFSSELLLFGADGVELKRVSLPNMSLYHAVETSRGTFIVSRSSPQPQVVEIDDTGHVIRVNSHQLQFTRQYLALDSDGRVFVADHNKYRVLLLNSRLELERVLLDPHEVLPWRLCYVEQTGQFIVTSNSGTVYIYEIRS